LANVSYNFAFANEEENFAVIEDVGGTVKKITSSDRIYSIGPVDFGQEREFLDDEQIRANASAYSPIKGRKNPGDWGMETYVKPSGTPGTPPEQDVLFQALMGTKTVNSGVDVQYTLANQLDSFTLWSKKGHTVYIFRGATVQTAGFSIAGNDVARISWGGNYIEQHYASEGIVTSIAGNVLTMKGNHVLRYTEGTYVEVGDDDNSGAGFKITSINYTTNKITLDGNPSPGGGTPATVTPWWPSSGSEVGTPGHGKLGLVTVDGSNAIIMEASVDVNNNIKYYEEEKNNQWTAERFARPTKRGIEGSLRLKFLDEGNSYFYRADYQISDALIIPVGNVSGYIMELQIPYAEYRTPSISGGEEFEQEIPFVAVAGSGNDEFKIVFK